MSFNRSNYEDFNSVTTKIGCQAYFARKRGKGHIESGTICQDYCLVETINDNVLVIAVADGHGGDAYVKSDIGARIACETIIQCVKNIFNGISSHITSDTWVQIFKNSDFKSKYINLWKSAVIKDYNSSSENEPEPSESNIIKKYGTTILFAIVTNSYYVLGQLGDGAILMFNNDGQCQLFKRHPPKTSSQTSSLASGRAEYAFMVDFFRRELFGNLLLSTDGIYDKLDMENSFLTYATSLLNKVQKNQPINNPFEIDGIDISEISKDDCTIALMISDIPTPKYELKMPPWCECRNIEFVRVYNGLEIYRTYDEEDILEVHVVDGENILRALDLKNCLIPVPKGSRSMPSNKRMYSFALPKGIIRLQKLIEYGEHLEKRYWFNDMEYVQEENTYDENNLYSNEFWMDIYEKIMLIEKEFEIIKIYPLPAMFDTAYITVDRKIFLFPDTLIRQEFSKEKLSLAFKSFYDHFSIMGKLSCGKISIPLFRCPVQGQNIKALHTIDANSSLCRVIYNKEKDVYGLFNLSGKVWNVDDGKGKPIAPQGVLRLRKNQSFAIKNTESAFAAGAETMDGFAIYTVELF